MKIIRDNVCYVSLDDVLFLAHIPKFVFEETDFLCCDGKEFKKYTKRESIDFFASKGYILDYDSVCNLSDEDLDNKIMEVRNKLNELVLKLRESAIVLNSMYRRKRMERDIVINQEIENLKHFLASIIKYRDNRVEYDNEIAKLVQNQKMRLVLRNVK